ncbi:MAG: hypothetical protein WC840_00800 [Candidatus Peribacteraceae bacterium]
MHRTRSAFCICIALTVLSACTRGSPPEPVKTGPASATGTLIPAEVSLTRRGSHALVAGGKTQFFLESKKENLQEFEGQTVFVSGNLEPNFRPEDLPVLVVEYLRASRGQEPLHDWDVPALNLRIRAPETWGATIEKGVVSFTLLGEETPLLIISLTSSGSLPSGAPIFVAGRRGVRTTPEKGTLQDVYFADKDVSIRFHFDVSRQRSVQRVEEGQILLTQFENLLASASFLSDRSSSSSLIPSLTGTGASTGGTPCGGSAGVLCPAGFFCDITDAVENIGNCRRL